MTTLPSAHVQSRTHADVSETRHLRIHVFDKWVIAVEQESEALDWRPNLDVPMQCVVLEPLHEARRSTGPVGLYRPEPYRITPQHDDQARAFP